MSNLIHNGDIALYAPHGKGNFYQRSIQHMGCVSTHGELLEVTSTNEVLGGCAHKPHFEFVPLDDRIKDPNVDLAVYRYHRFCGLHYETAWYERYQEVVSGILRSWDELEPEYDSKAIRGIVYNALLRLIGGPALMGFQTEHDIYCIESIDIIARAAGVDLFTQIRPQRYFAPVHCERLVLARQWLLVKDYGLDVRIRSMSK